MNRTFKVMFSKARASMVVASEAACCAQKKSTKAVVAAAVALALSGAAMAESTVKSGVGVSYDGQHLIKAEEFTGKAEIQDGVITIISDGYKSTSYGAFSNIYTNGNDEVADGVTVTGQFTNNSSTNTGGAMALWHDANQENAPTNTVQNAHFENNSASDLGGALTVHSWGGYTYAGKTTVTGSTFKGNWAGNQGGAAAFENNTANITNSTFEANGKKADGSLTTNGGAVYAYSAFNDDSKGKTTLDIRNSTFTNNAASNRGGAVYIDSSTLTVDDGSRFTRNEAKSGGAIAIADGISNKEEVFNHSIKNAIFDGNTATDKGGAIVVFNEETDDNRDNNLKLENVTFTNNSAKLGGAIVTEAAMTITGNARFEGNSATENGGAIYVSAQGSNAPKKPATLTLDTGDNGVITFANNTANGAANDIHLGTEKSTLTMTGKGSIALNSGLSGNGMVTSNASKVYVADMSNFTGSLTINGGEFAVEAGSLLNTEKTVFGEGSSVSIETGGELKLAGVTTAGALNLGAKIGEEDLANVTFDSAFLDATLDEGKLVVETDTQIFDGENFQSVLGSDAGVMAENMRNLYARGATAREAQILADITERYTDETGSISRSGVEALKEAAGGNATAGVLNVAYDAQALISETITRHQLKARKGMGLWVDAFASSNEDESLYGTSGYSTDIYGGVLGFDATFENDVTVGGALTFGTADTDAENASAASQLDTDFYGVSLYAGKRFDRLTFTGELGYVGFNNDYSGIGDAGDAEAWSAGVRADAVAYDGEVLRVVPHVGVRYVHIEGDAVAFNDEAKMDIVEMPVGLSVQGAFETASMRIVPELDFTVVPQLADKDVETFAGNIDILDSLYNTTLGIAAEAGNFSFGLNYRYGFGNEDRRNHTFNANVRYAF